MAVIRLFDCQELLGALSTRGCPRVLGVFVLANKREIAQSSRKDIGPMVCKERVLMKKTVLGLSLAAMALSGCMTVDGGASDGVLAKVPEEVLAIADPKQNLGAVRVNPVDGCFEYRHIGPVETLFASSKQRRPPDLHTEACVMLSADQALAVIVSSVGCKCAVAPTVTWSYSPLM